MLPNFKFSRVNLQTQPNIIHLQAFLYNFQTLKSLDGQKASFHNLSISCISSIIVFKVIIVLPDMISETEIQKENINEDNSSQIFSNI